MKKKHILITALICLVAVFCSACSSGTPLAKAAAKLQKSAEKGYYEITYVEADDKLVIAITDRTDLDALFETLNKYIDGKDVGTLIFDTRVGDDINNGTARTYCDKIAALPCSSIKVLGVGPVLSEYIRWAPAVQKADLVYMAALLDPDLAKDNQMLADTENAALLTSVERLWISDVHLSDLKYYPPYRPAERPGRPAAPMSRSRDRAAPGGACDRP